MTFTISDPALTGMPSRHPLSGSETLEPVPQPDRSPPITQGRLQSHSDTHLAKSFSRWLSDPGRFRFRQAQPAREYWAEARAGTDKGNRSRPPFDRLKWWTVRHQLRERLAPYETTDTPSMFRNASWSTLVYWSMLLDGIEIEEAVKV